MVQCCYCEELLQPDIDQLKCNGCECKYCFGCSLKEGTYKTMSKEKKITWRCQRKCRGKFNPPSSKSTIKIEGFENILKEVKDRQSFISNQYNLTLNEIKELKKQNQSLKDEIIGLKRKV